MRLTFLDISGREAKQHGLSAIISQLPSLQHLRYSAEAPLKLVIERPGGLLLDFVPPPTRQHLGGRSASAPARLAGGALDLLQAAAALV